MNDADADAGGQAFGPNSPSWPSRLAELASEEPTPRRRELRRLADATRRVLHTMVMNGADADTLAAAADALEAVADDLHHHAQPSQSIYEGFGEAATSGNPHGFFDHSPMLGVANPIAPPIVLRGIDERTMEGAATFGPAYEGPPGCVHGGYIAAAFDEVLGAVQSLSGQPGMTGTLIVRYRSPTPLHEPLRFTGRFEGVEGRKILTTGTLHAGDRLCAEAEGIFISVDFGRMAELRSRRAEQQARRDDRT
ncbi:MAG TPA: PaaI family thioesterase [Acidimicrobiales bacterium]|nr:PaaI family thioesterase [Acidimicrobiales bacterium]